MNTKNIFNFITAAMLWASCSNSKTETVDTEIDAEIRTPVTVTKVSYETLQDYVEFNATSKYLQMITVKATTTGYIKSSSVKFASPVRSGQTIFSIITKEAASIGNTINKLDPGFKFSGINAVKAAAPGYITELNHQVGDFVQEGEQLAVISDSRSFVFVLDMPYEFRQLMLDQKEVTLTMPDGERMQGTILNSMPLLDSSTQTQSLQIKVFPAHPIPQNLVAKVRIIKSSKAAAASLPKEAILANETAGSFWVMKLINDSTAVKVDITKGVEIRNKVEILTPDFQPTDKILISGNYGLSDTARVKVIIEK